MNGTSPVDSPLKTFVIQTTYNLWASYGRLLQYAYYDCFWKIIIFAGKVPLKTDHSSGRKPPVPPLKKSPS